MKAKMSAKNVKFWELSKAEKRVAIAKDVLRQIDDKRIHVKQDMYFELGRVPKEVEDKLDKFLENSPPCTVCALGACFASMVILGDRVSISSVVSLRYYDGKYIPTERLDDTRFRIMLRRAFTSTQISLIESAFEKFNAYDMDGNGFKIGEGNYGPSYDRAIEFGHKIKSNRKRLIAIMENIIENKGTFKP